MLQTHENTLKQCNNYLLRVFGMGWDDLPDTVTIWDYIDEEAELNLQLVKDICWEKLADEYPDRCELNKIIYGECSCGLHDARQIEMELEAEENE